MHALPFICGNKLFELELDVVLLASLASLRLFHGPTRATSAGFFVLSSEAIRDVEQTTPVCKATSVLPSTMQGAQKAPLFN